MYILIDGIEDTSEDKCASKCDPEFLCPKKNKPVLLFSFKYT
jgi:hypothetical protein